MGWATTSHGAGKEIGVEAGGRGGQLQRAPFRCEGSLAFSASRDGRQLNVQTLQKSGSKREAEKINDDTVQDASQMWINVLDSAT